MNIKSILTIYQGHPSEQEAARTAMQIAEKHHACAKFLHIVPDFEYLYSTEAFAAYGATALAVLKEDAEKRYATQKKNAEKGIAYLSNIYRLPLRGRKPANPIAYARFVPVVGDMKTVVREHGQTCDLVIVGKGGGYDNQYYEDVIAAALAGTGRPVLYIPPRKRLKGLTVDEVCLAWDGSLEASRAIYNCISLLKPTARISILTVAGKGERPDTKNLEEYLEAHSFATKTYHLRSNNRPVGEILMAKAIKLKADAVVMGAYHHARAGQMIWGGVTRWMLERSKMPLLLVH